MAVLPLVAALLLHVSVAPDQWDVDYKYGQRDYELLQQDPHCDWKCMLFTLQWPGTFCQMLDNETLCKIPPNVNNWTIHGLWPVKVYSCCNCWPMFHSDIKDLEADLTLFWPSLLKTHSSFQFWRNEWHKHGVCAACVEGFNSPQKYFQTCLDLRARFDVQGLLEKAGITPSCNQTYKVEQVQRVVAPLFGTQYEIQCVSDEQGRELWFQLKVSLFRNLTTGCGHKDLTMGRDPAPAHPCPRQAPLYYLPIDHRQPPRPCE